MLGSSGARRQAQAEMAPAVGGSGTLVLVRVATQGKLMAQRGLSAGAAQRWCERGGGGGGEPF